ncbi:phage antirepressor KilAC domain-containing protein [uncultured Halomonas sp.]|uniref:phage antirepressor KilAC domain-containing protein n=1 Tax=uncultured Halomonas sp. TaxID=173971 RepID=UPI002592F338|nr:phage antirepressor KilAC domain-containing protein [uncultured Halomonas sp.]|tara:strand:- start:2015 stop:2713 length:699 start_codon:yes stop_codon:yes gene_type:complete
MNHIIETSKPTMSSREIAELTGKQHQHVKRDIEKMLESLGRDASTFGRTYQDSQNRFQTEYLLDRYHTEVLVTGYDVKRRAAVIKRWYDLETGAAKPALPDFTNPVEAARAWADEVESKLRAEAALEHAKPAVEFVERYVSADSGNKGFRQVAKLLQANEREFRAFLQDSRVMYRLGGEWMPYQQHIDADRFVVKTGVTEDGGHSYSQAKFTPKGVNWIAGLWAQYKIAGAA